jgi:hypothetical protein
LKDELFNIAGLGLLCLLSAGPLWGCKADPAPPAPAIKPASAVVARLQSGRFKIGGNEGSRNVLTKDVTFPEPFKAVPVVVVTPSHFDPHPDIVVANVVNITTTGFRVLLHRADVPVAGWGLELQLEWIAVDYGGGTANLLGGN